MLEPYLLLVRLYLFSPVGSVAQIKFMKQVYIKSKSEQYKDVINFHQMPCALGSILSLRF